MIGPKLAALGKGGEGEGYTLEEAESSDVVKTMYDIKQEEDELRAMIEEDESELRRLADLQDLENEMGLTSEFLLAWHTYDSKQMKFVIRTRGKGGRTRKRNATNRYMQCAIICSAMRSQFPEREKMINSIKATTFQ